MNNDKFEAFPDQAQESSHCFVTCSRANLSHALLLEELEDQPMRNINLVNILIK